MPEARSPRSPDGLSAVDRYEIFALLMRHQATQHEVAEKFDVDPAVVAEIYRVGRRGALDALAGRNPDAAELPR